MGEARKRCERGRNNFALDAERSRGAIGERSVLSVVRAAERARVVEIDKWSRLAVRHNLPVLNDDLAGWRIRTRDRHNAPPSGPGFQAVEDVSANVVVNPNQRDLGSRDETLFDGSIVREIAVSIEMIGRDVDEEADAWRERGRKVDLI
jgi:hypothetical protein